jgi:hypothetical protein
LSSDELFELNQEMQSVLREKLITKRKMLEDSIASAQPVVRYSFKGFANLVALQGSTVVDERAWRVISPVFAELSPPAFQVPQSS